MILQTITIIFSTQVEQGKRFSSQCIFSSVTIVYAKSRACERLVLDNEASPDGETSAARRNCHALILFLGKFDQMTHYLITYSLIDVTMGESELKFQSHWGVTVCRKLGNWEIDFSPSPTLNRVKFFAQAMRVACVGGTASKYLCISAGTGVYTYTHRLRVAPPFKGQGAWALRNRFY